MTPLRVILLAAFCVAATPTFAQSGDVFAKIAENGATCAAQGYTPGTARYRACQERLALVGYVSPSCPTGPNPFRSSADELYPQCYGSAWARSHPGQGWVW